MSQLELVLKRCSNCNKMKPISEFYRDKSSIDGLTSRCKECDKEKSRQFYKDNPDYFVEYKKENRESILLTQRECNFLYGAVGRGGGYLLGTGICVFCGEINPFLLELHHPFGRDNPFKIHECANCHRLQHRFPAMLKVALDISLNK